MVVDSDTINWLLSRLSFVNVSQKVLCAKMVITFCRVAVMALTYILAYIRTYVPTLHIWTTEKDRLKNKLSNFINWARESSWHMKRIVRNQKQENDAVYGMNIFFPFHWFIFLHLPIPAATFTMYLFRQPDKMIYSICQIIFLFWKKFSLAFGSSLPDHTVHIVGIPS